MEKAVLISIQPKWCELIASGKKTVEIRKSRPKIETPFKVYIYCTNTRPYLVWGDVFRGDWETEFTHLSGYNRKDAEKIWDVFNGKVIGEFVCNEIECFTTDYRADDKQNERISKHSCVPMIDLMEYESNAPCLYGWHISNLIIYDEPKELSEFYRVCEKPECDDCPYLHFENTPNSYEGWCTVNEKIPLKRPPQSWCYVEELK